MIFDDYLKSCGYDLNNIGIDHELLKQLQRELNYAPLKSKRSN